MDLVEDDVLQLMTEIAPQPLKWAWEGMIPLGKVTLLTGDPGAGKSLVALQVAAMVTRGWNFPPGISGPPETFEMGGTAQTPTPEVSAATRTEARPRAVVLLSGEDLVEDTVRPRLEAAGADLSQVFLLREHCAEDRATIGEDDGHKPSEEAHDSLFQLSRDLPRLESSLKRIQESGREIGLIVIDPIERYFGPTDKKQDRIEVVRRLVDLAARTGAAVLVITNSSFKTGNRGATALSQELVQAARSVLMVAQDLEDNDQRMVLPVKLNLSAMRPGALFSIRNGVVHWENRPITLTGDQYLTQARVKQKNPLVREEVYEIQRVMKWLKDELTPGRASSLWVRQRAAGYDIAYGTLRRAFKNLGCWTSKVGKQWFWHLPSHEESASEEERNTMLEFPNGDGFGVYRESMPYWMRQEIAAEEARNEHAQEGAQRNFTPESLN